MKAITLFTGLILVCLPVVAAIDIPATGRVFNDSVPAQTECRMEFAIRNWSTTPDTTALVTNSCGVNITYDTGQKALYIYWIQGNAGTGPCVGEAFFMPLTGIVADKYTIRIQVTTAGNSGAGLAARTITVEGWKTDPGVRVFPGDSLPNINALGTCTYTKSVGSPSAGVALGSLTSAQSVRFDWFREYNTLVPMNSQMPTTTPSSSFYNSGRVVEYKFQNSLADAGGTYDLSYTNVACVADACYAAGFTGLLVPAPKTLNAPIYSTWKSMKAGATNQLDGTASFSLAQDTDAVAYAWSHSSGPSTLVYADATAAQPSVTGAIFGSYTENLTVTDSNGATASADLVLGAVAYDANGLVQSADPHVAELFGPQIAFGQNPWGYEDERNLYAINAQIGYQATNYDSGWSTTGAGTVAYPFEGKGNGLGPACTTLSGSILSTDTTITVADASCLSLAGLPGEPTWIMIGNNLGAVQGTPSQEAVRICSRSGNVLTVCYDGRGLAGNSNHWQGTLGATAWPSGTRVGEMRVQGTSTLFGTDTDRPICPAGLPGPPGAVAYTTGTVTFAASSTLLTSGSSAFWAPANNVLTGGYMRAVPTHGGGSSFVWWGQITQIATYVDVAINSTDTSMTVATGATGFPSTPFLALIEAEQVTVTAISGTTWTITRHVNGTTAVDHARFATVIDPLHLRSNRPLPSDIDGAAFSYKITSPSMYLSLEFVAPDGHVARLLQNGLGCESETAMFADVEHDISTVTSAQTGVHYSYKTQLSLYSTAGTFTSNFYGVGMAARNFYYRSGWGPALTLANSIDEYAVRDPEIGDGFVGGTPLTLGGTAIGGMIDLVLNSATVLTWPNVEQFAVTGSIGARNCNYTDTRDGGYLTAWTTLAANYDTNSTNRAAFKSALGLLLTRDQGCKRNAPDYVGAEVNSFSNAFAWAPFTHLVTGAQVLTDMVLTTGDTAVTGTDFVPAMCSGGTTGTIQVTHGSSSATVRSGTLSQLYRIYITDTTSSPLYVGAYEYSVAGSAVQLAALWPGEDGIFSFMSEAAEAGGLIQTGIWTSNADTLADNQALEKSWACIYNSSTSLTLNRPWDAANGSAYHLSRYYVGTFGQQPFMFGVKTNQVKWASQNDDPTIAAGYAAIKPLMGEWFNTYGYDSTNSKGVFYNSVWGICNDPRVVADGSSFYSIHGWDPATGQPGCGLTGAMGASTARVNSAEGGAAMIQYYLADPTPERKAVVDEFYGAIFGYAPLCHASVLSTCNGTATNMTNSDFNLYKWPGFFFGMGGFFTNSWPAIRTMSDDSPPETSSGGKIHGSPRIRGRGKIADNAPSRWRKWMDRILAVGSNLDQTATAFLGGL